MDPGPAERDEVEALISERRAANPRRTPGREPAGAPTTRRWLAATGVAVAVATAVLAVVLALGTG